MLELIYAIPEELGWAIVGALATITLIMLGKLAVIGFKMWKMYQEDKLIED